MNTCATVNPAPAWLADWARRHPAWAQRYFQIDPRSLGLLRLYVGALLLVDMIQRASSLPTWATLLCSGVYVVFLVGQWTRLFHILAAVALIASSGGLSLFDGQRTGDLQLLSLWTLSLPLHARFSIDALQARLRAPKEVRPEALSHRHLFTPNHAPIISLAVVAILSLRALISGSALVWQTDAIGPIGYASPVDRLLLACAVLLLLSPWYWKRCRDIALALAMIYAIRCNAFSIVGWFLLFLSDADWAWVARVFGPSGARSRIVYIDASCGVCFALSRLLARLDTFNHLTIVANDLPGRPAEVTDELVQKTIVVEDPITQRRWIKSAAFAEIFAALPAGAPIAWLLRVPFLGWIANPAYDLFANNRGKVSVALGMAACGLPNLSPAANQLATQPPEQERAQLANVREAAVVVAFVVCCWLIANAPAQG